MFNERIETPARRIHDCMEKYGKKMWTKYTEKLGNESR